MSEQAIAKKKLNLSGLGKMTALEQELSSIQRGDIRESTILQRTQIGKKLDQNKAAAALADKKVDWSLLNDENKLQLNQQILTSMLDNAVKQSKIDKEKVLIVRFDNMMSNFESVMDDIISFTNQEITDLLLEKIKTTSESQRAYKSRHKYDLQKFGLSEDQIKKDCIHIYETFLS